MEYAKFFTTCYFGPWDAEVLTKACFCGDQNNFILNLTQNWNSLQDFHALFLFEIECLKLAIEQKSIYFIKVFGLLVTYKSNCQQTVPYDFLHLTDWKHISKLIKILIKTFKNNGKIVKSKTIRTLLNGKMYSRPLSSTATFLTTKQRKDNNCKHNMTLSEFKINLQQ